MNVSIADNANPAAPGRLLVMEYYLTCNLLARNRLDQ